jgi:hypothetical protein
MVDILGFAKILNNTGEASGFTRDDFHHEIQKRAAATRLSGETSAQAYTRVLLTPEGKELYKAYRAAPAPVQAAQDFPLPKEKPEPAGPASREFDDLAHDMARKKGISFQQAHARLYTDPERAELVRRVKIEERDQTARVAASRSPIASATREFGRDGSLGRNPASGRM